jgi:mRNA interferase MazF
MTVSEPAPPIAAWDIVAVPFPYIDRPTRQRRPALVVRVASNGLLWVLMITSAENRGWPGDVAVEGAATGLPVPSLIRTEKIATVEASAARRIGHASARPRSVVLGLLRDWLNQTADKR